MSECITVALQDLRDYHDPSKKKKSQLEVTRNFYSARHWLLREDDYGLYSFLQCCDVLGLSPYAIRDRVKEYVVEIRRPRSSSEE